MSATAARDVMVVLGDLVDDSSPAAEPSSPKRTAALRFRDNVVETAVLQPVKEGEALHGEVVRLKPLAAPNPITEHPVGAHFSAARQLGTEFPAFDVEVMYRSSETRGEQSPPAASSEIDRSRAGPARVSNTAYRSNYSRVFGDKKKTLN